jgi:hypothetical protein
MNARIVAVAVLGVPLLAGAAPAAAPADTMAWVHVRVEEPQQRSRVHVNLPLPAVEAALKAAPDVIASEGRVHFGGHGAHHLEIDDLRQMWAELKNAGDTDIVSVEEDDERVNVSRKGDLVQVRVQNADGREKVHVDVPVSLVDALFSGSKEELNVRAAVGELRKLRGDVVRVEDHGSTVRIWVDERPEADGGK